MARKAGTLRNDGFSLLEMSIVLLVLSIVTGSALTIATNRIESAKVDATMQRLDVIEDAMRQYFRVMGRLPCPASATLGTSDANFGFEAANPGVCTGGTPAAYASGGTPPAVAAYGSVPVKTLQLPDEAMFDGWDRRFDYHVDIRMTEASAGTTYPITGTDLGAIDIKDASAAAYTITPAQPNGAVMALVSHGNNGFGAFTKAGSASLVQSDTSSADEQENCDCNALSAHGTYDTTLVTHAEISAGANYFDDIVRYKMRFFFTNPEKENIIESAYDGPELVAGGTSGSYLYLYGVNATTDTFSKQNDPTSLPASSIYDTEFSQDNKYFAITQTVAPYVMIYKVTGNYVALLSGQPDVAPTGIGRGVAWSPNGSYLVVTHSTAPYITIYNQSATDIFTKLVGQPTSTPAATGNGAAFSPDGNYLAFGTSDPAFNYLKVYRRSGNTFTPHTSPSAGFPNASVLDVAWSPDGDFLAAAFGGGGPYAAVYSVSSGTFTKITAGDTGEFADAADLPTGTGKNVTFSNDGAYLAISYSGTPGINIYKWNGTKFVKISGQPTGGTPGAASNNYSVDFSNNDSYLALASSDSPNIYIYKHVGDTFTRVADPAILPGASVNSLAFRK